MGFITCNSELADSLQPYTHLGARVFLIPVAAAPRAWLPREMDYRKRLLN
jgi:hypothetical protein